jgi:hypothetical protein
MMKRVGSAFLVFLFLFAVTPFANAIITGWNCADDKDGAIVMNSVSLVDDTLSMACTQSDYPGHVLGDFTTDTEEDPTVKLLQSVENDTDFAWTDYHITIGMTKSFSILTTGLVAPVGWTWTIVDPVSGQPLPGDISPGTGWVGKVNYVNVTGDPIAIDDEGLFGFKVSFLGSVAFYTEQIPTPEPATIGLLGLGALAVMRKRRA